MRIVSIDARDRTPGHGHEHDEAVGRTRAARAGSPGATTLQREALVDAADAPSLRAGERAVPLSIDPSAAPPLSLLRAGAHTDVVAEHDATRRRAGAAAG